MVESKMTVWDERRMCHVKGQATYPPTQKTWKNRTKITCTKIDSSCATQNASL